MLKHIVDIKGNVSIVEMSPEEIEKNKPAIIWDFDKPIRIILSDSDIVQLFKDIPPFRDYIDSMGDTTVSRNGNQYIYLSEVYPEHQALLGNYSSYSLDERK